MVLDRWLENGKLLIDEKNPQHKAWGARLGEKNIQTTRGVYAPYVVDRIARRVRFADYELRLTASGLEFWKGDAKLNTLSITPEVNTGVWERKTPTVSGLAWVESEDHVDVSYKVTTPEMENTITLRLGRGAKVNIDLGIRALATARQRVSVDFAEKGTRPKQTDRVGKVTDAPRIEFASGSFWAWRPEEDIDHDEIDDPVKTRIAIKEKDYTEGEVSLVSPDTWGPTDIVSNLDDGGDSDGGGWAVNGTDANNFFIDHQYNEDCGVSWTLPAIAAGATINKMYTRWYYTNNSTGTPTGVLRIEDSDPATAARWAIGHEPSAGSWINTDMGTVTFDTGEVSNFVFGEGETWATNLSSALTDLMTSYGAIGSGDRINIAGLRVGSSSGYAGFEDYSNAGTNEAQLYLDWTEGGGGGIAMPVVMLQHDHLAGGVR